MTNEKIMFFIDDDGKAHHYDSTYDVTIHCETEEDQKKLLNSIVITTEGKTNGDMIQKFIPTEDIWRTYSPVHGKQVCVRFKHTEYVTCFEESYWDAPYKREREDNND